MDRVGREPLIIHRPTLTIAVTTQPEVLRGLLSTDGMRGQGVLARFLYALPQSTVGKRDTNPPTMSNTVGAAYDRLVRRLLELSISLGHDDAPLELLLTLEARARFDAAMCHLEPDLAEDGEMATFADWGSKWAGQVARISGILHLAENAYTAEPWTIPISCETMAAALAIGEWAKPHAQAFFNEAGTAPQTNDARKVLAWIIRNGRDEFTHQEAWQGVKSSLKEVSRFDVALSLLGQRGYIRHEPAPRSSSAGRPGRGSYLVNPAALKLDPVTLHPVRMAA